MKKSSLIITLILLFNGCQDVGDTKPLLSDTKEKQPIIIVNKNRHLNMADFWLERVDNPDKLIMSPQKITQFNHYLQTTQGLTNSFENGAKSYQFSWIKNSILHSFNSLKSRATYFEDGNRIDANFYKDIKKELNLNLLQSDVVEPKFALTINYCDQKVIPTQLSLLKKRNQIHFDRNQNSALDIATPLVVLHSSSDGQWVYGIGPTSSGWVRRENIAFGTKKEIADYLNSKNFIVTTAPKTALKIAGHYHDILRMGVKLPTLLTIDNETMVLVPTANEKGELIFSNATVDRANVHQGYLAYTPKNILTQAFKFLHLPYGWGGMYGEQDCSKFIQEVYATVGIQLPRNSTSQANSGEAKINLQGISKNQKERRLSDSTIIGGSIIHLKGHITLYIGDYKGEPYIIHTVWGESSRHFALGRTAVTSLNFNSYLKKIDKITNIIWEE